MPLISNLAIRAQMPWPMESIRIDIITSTAKEERIPETRQRCIIILAFGSALLMCYSMMICVHNFHRRRLRARDDKHVGAWRRISYSDGRRERKSIENQQEGTSNETTAAASDSNFLWAKMNNELLYKGGEDIMQSVVKQEVAREL